jgi:hypothetical protein
MQINELGLILQMSEARNSAQLEIVQTFFSKVIYFYENISVF